MANNQISRAAVYHHIDRERAYQIEKYGQDRQQSLGGFLLILESELNEAKRAWVKGGTGRDSALSEVLQVAAVAVAALEKYGAQGCPVPSDDGVG